MRRLWHGRRREALSASCRRTGRTTLASRSGPVRVLVKTMAAHPKHFVESRSGAVVWLMKFRQDLETDLHRWWIENAAVLSHHHTVLWQPGESHLLFLCCTSFVIPPICLWKGLLLWMPA